MVPSPELQTDTETARAFLEEITLGWDALPEPCDIELRCLFPGRTPLIARYSPDQIGFDMLLDDAAGMNRHGLNAYAVVNPVRASAPLRRDGKMSGAYDEDIVASFFFWADGDDEKAANSIRNFAGPKYTMAVTTGTVPYPRPHIYWRIKDGPHFDLAEWRTVQEGIAAVLSTDETVVNASRIMRIPGFINWPTEKKKAKGRVPEVSTFRTKYPDERPPVPFEQMQRAFAGASPKAQTLSQQATPAAPPSGFQIDTGEGFKIDTGNAPTTSSEVQDLLSYIPPDCGYADWLAVLMGLHDKFGGSAEGLSIADQWSAGGTKYVPGEVAAKWRGFEVGGGSGLGSIAELARQNGADLSQIARQHKGGLSDYADPAALLPPQADPSFDAPPRAVPAIEWFDDVQPALADSYLIKGVIGQGAMSVVYGPSNSGKTFFAMDLAFHIAIGASWRGLRIKQAAVLYIAAEGGRGVANRIAALRSVTGVCDVPMAMRRGGMDLLKAQADLQAVCDMAAEVQATHTGKPLLIVIDTLSRIMAGGDENNAADMTTLIRNIDAIREATGAHIMLVHHTGKDAARGARGHSSLRAATDTEIEVSNDGGARAAMVTKQRDYQGGETFAFELKSVELGIDQDGDKVTSCVVQAGDEEEYHAKAKMKKGLGGNQKILADAFDQLAAEIGKPNPGGVGMPERGQFLTVPMEDFRTFAMGKMAASNKRGAFIEAWKALSDGRGMFCAASDLVWRTDKRIK